MSPSPAALTAEDLVAFAFVNEVTRVGTGDIGWHISRYKMGDATPWRDGHRLVDRSPLTFWFDADP